jgi:glyoxylase-like metal-dependent hydrolase (beta-lactamase superfamily II)
MDYRVISIGTLSRHPLWNETTPARTPHATTTLIRTADKAILVDPALPSPAIEARLAERSGLPANQITDVFLTNFRPAHRRGLSAFPQAKWWISEAEREAVGRQLLAQFERAEDQPMRDLLRDEIALLRKVHPAPDKLADQVDLFPLPGYTPGTAGLLLPLATATVLIAGDAVASAEHLERGQILPGAFDVEQAMESLKEAMEIADWIIPGHDNIIPNLTRRSF